VPPYDVLAPLAKTELHAGSLCEKGMPLPTSASYQAR